LPALIILYSAPLRKNFLGAPKLTAVGLGSRVFILNRLAMKSRPRGHDA
jgi:hypothetical protein